MSRARCFVNAVGIANAIGNGREAVRKGLLAGDTSGMVLEKGLLPDAPALVGRVAGNLAPLPDGNARVDCRNNRLLMLALNEIGDRKSTRLNSSH